MDPKIKVGVLGATGVVGQQFVYLLEQHPWFELVCVASSSRRDGKQYGQSVTWRQTRNLSPAVAQLILGPCEPRYFREAECQLVFSGLDASAAKDIEQNFAEEGFPVFSNASSHRMDTNVPILIPFINHEHLKLIENQATYQSSKGFIVTNANCSSTGLTLALAPLYKEFGGIKKVIVNTMQALSGAGYPGVPSLSILGNVIPFIPGEEKKIETEPKKIFGRIVRTNLEESQMAISAMCHRVPVLDGHTLSVSIKFNDPGKDLIERASMSYVFWEIPEEIQQLPSCPSKIFYVHTKEDRPQPRLDCVEDQGMVTSVGRIRECPIFDLKISIASHNTIIGAAGGSLLNAEFAVAKGYIKARA